MNWHYFTFSFSLYIAIFTHVHNIYIIYELKFYILFTHIQLLYYWSCTNSPLPPAFAGSNEWYCVLCSYGWNIYTPWRGRKRCSNTWEIFAGLLHQHTEEIERYQSSIKANRFLHLKERRYAIVNGTM